MFPCSHPQHAQPIKTFKFLSIGHNKMKEEFAAAVDMPRKTVADKIDNFGDLGNVAKSCKTLANHEAANP